MKKHSNMTFPFNLLFRYIICALKEDLTKVMSENNHTAESVAISTCTTTCKYSLFTANT